ncbi:thioredoxin [Candidatus Pacearchaeota archaeon CG10_big_fil_rev_8_21_14_0_10_35_13]|nr:MAG: thioredoxin [Candidatus Pacearchaeota archaeon CG10_big_fil_rev_8_21_14_0_10_35_13]
MVKIISTTPEFEKEVKSGMVVVDFFANWCMPCLMMAPVIDELSEKLEDINFIKVDVDDHQELAHKFGVMSIPTLIVFVDGKEVNRIVGAMPEEALTEKIMGLFA